MKFRLLLVTVSVTLLLLVLATTVFAQGEPPPPYAGLKNLFPWNDTSAQESGEGLYQQYCLGCHGATGGSIASADFSTADYPQSLEERPDLYFWVLSEGRLDKGMPPYKSSVSEEQRWHILTYLWSLGKVASPGVTPSPAKPPTEVENGALLLTAPEQAQSGQPVTLTTVLQDIQGKPIGSAMVKFFIRVEFFTSGLMEIGGVLTNDQGIAVFEYTPRQTGDIQIVARYKEGGLKDIETATMISLTENSEPFYQAEAGIRLPAPGQDVFLGPESALELGEKGQAPTSAFRLPGGILSWLLLVVATVALIWFTYFRILYQVFRIPIVSEIRDTDTRLVPLAGLIIVVAMGILLVLMLVTGPYSHFNLLR